MKSLAFAVIWFAAWFIAIAKVGTFYLEEHRFLFCLATVLIGSVISLTPLAILWKKTQDEKLGRRN